MPKTPNYKRVYSLNGGLFNNYSGYVTASRFPKKIRRWNSWRPYVYVLVESSIEYNPEGKVVIAEYRYRGWI